MFNVSFRLQIVSNRERYITIFLTKLNLFKTINFKESEEDQEFFSLSKYGLSFAFEIPASGCCRYRTIVGSVGSQAHFWHNKFGTQEGLHLADPCYAARIEET